MLYFHVENSFVFYQHQNIFFKSFASLLTVIALGNIANTYTMTSTIWVGVTNFLSLGWGEKTNIDKPLEALILNNHSMHTDVVWMEQKKKWTPIGE